MMQKIDASDDRITRLSALFRAHTVGLTEDNPPEPAADPRALLEEERKRVFAQAHDDGYEQGMRQAQSEIQDATDRARRECQAAHAEAIAELEAQRDRLDTLLRRLPDMVDSIEESALEVAAELAYASLLRVLQDVPPVERVAAVCRLALREQQQRPVVLRVGLADAAALEGLGDDRAVRTEVDARLQSGQCQLETSLGLSDTGLEIRLESLKQAFLRGLSGSEA